VHYIPSPGAKLRQGRRASQKKWYNIMEKEDFRALPTLIYSHINLYGKFDLNMEERLALDMLAN